MLLASPKTFFLTFAIPLDSLSRSTYTVLQTHEAGAASPRKNHPQRSSGMKKKGKKDEKKTPKKGK